MPTPFLVGRVNCYLIEDRPLTLIDTGPNSGKSLDELERALAEPGAVIAAVLSAGYREVVIDEQPFRSGSLNHPARRVDLLARRA